ncbi:MAG TPA: vitamin B12 dependent-methionine synthase activation domain-containing protein [Bacteroidales bacterium]|nr:vitamin B12 dependent-methionine synthase activation domain-containing protein [Bacteroidales bacterium]
MDNYNLFTYRFSFNELDISRHRIEHVMGYEQDTIPEPFPEMIDKILESAAEYCEIQGGYRMYDHFSLESTNQSILINKTSLNIHKIIFQQIKRADKIAVFLCTAGPKIGEWSRQLMAEGDLMNGYIVDIVGSEIVEGAMDRIQAALAEDMKFQGSNISNRYSPGYCSWDVSEQHKLFSLLPPNFCNVRLTDTALMYPIKTVSGLIGIGKEVKYNAYTCQICDMQNCLYRHRKS